MRISDWSSDVCSSDLIDDDRLVRRFVDAEVEELARELFARRGQILALVEHDATGARGDGFGQEALEQALRRFDPLGVLDLGDAGVVLLHRNALGPPLLRRGGEIGRAACWERER